MLPHIKLPVRTPAWIAGISIGLLAVSGVVAIARSIPASPSSNPGGSAASVAGTGSGMRANASLDDSQQQLQLQLAGTPATINRRPRAACAECGVVESMRQVERSGAVGGQDAVNVKAAGHASAGAIGQRAATAKIYEITVRFRDGSTTVFDKAGPQAWRPGNRVIVIGRPSISIASSN